MGGVRLRPSEGKSSACTERKEKKNIRLQTHRGVFYGAVFFEVGVEEAFWVDRSDICKCLISREPEGKRTDVLEKSYDSSGE